MYSELIKPKFIKALSCSSILLSFQNVLVNGIDCIEEIPANRWDKDALFDDAARLIVQNQVGSTSLLQRRMKLGYNRAGRLMDQLEASGIVGPNMGSKARDVLIKTELDLQQHLSGLG